MSKQKVIDEDIFKGRSNNNKLTAHAVNKTKEWLWIWYIQFIHPNNMIVKIGICISFSVCYKML